jgi:hypothetical protein
LSHWAIEKPAQWLNDSRVVEMRVSDAVSGPLPAQADMHVAQHHGPYVDRRRFPQVNLQGGAITVFLLPESLIR